MQAGRGRQLLVTRTARVNVHCGHAWVKGGGGGGGGGRGRVFVGPPLSSTVAHLGPPLIIYTFASRERFFPPI